MPEPVIPHVPVPAAPADLVSAATATVQRSDPDPAKMFVARPKVAELGGVTAVVVVLVELKLSDRITNALDDTVNDGLSTEAVVVPLTLG